MTIVQPDENKEWPAGPEVTDKARELILAYHPNLAMAQIRWYFVDRDTTRVKVSRLTGAKRFETRSDSAPNGLDFIVEIGSTCWQEAGNTDNRWALVDEALCRCGTKEARDGTLKFSVAQPDVTTFVAVVGRWGAYSDELEELAEIIGQGDPSVETRKYLAEQREARRQKSSETTSEETEPVAS